MAPIDVATGGPRPRPPGFSVTIRPIHVFPVFDAEGSGRISAWERREYDDVVKLDVSPREPPL